MPISQKVVYLRLASSVREFSTILGEAYAGASTSETHCCEHADRERQ